MTALLKGHFFYTGLDSIQGGKEIMVLDTVFADNATNPVWNTILYSSHGDGFYTKYRTEKVSEQSMFSNSGLLGRIDDNVVGQQEFDIRLILVPIHPTDA